MFAHLCIMAEVLEVIPPLGSCKFYNFDDFLL